MINWRRSRRKEHDKKRCNMVCQKALLRQIHNAGILSVEGVVGMDLIYRQQALDAIRNIKAITGTSDDEILLIDKAEAQTELMMLPSAQQCMTATSNTMVSETVKIPVMDGTTERLPSAEPRKKGKWIYGEKSGQDGWYCSECGGFIPWYYVFYGLDNIDFIEEFKTCPFCDSKMVSYTGADMKEGEESE